MIVNACWGEPICLGHETENDVEAVVFDKSAWIAAYGPGTFELVHKRRQDTDPLPVAVDVDGGVITWTLTESDTAYRGRGECQLSFYTPDGKLKKSEIFTTQTARSLVSGEDVPSPLEGWVEEVLKAAAGIQNMQAEAETLVPGSAATVTKTVDPDTGVVTLTFGIPEGLKGDTGRGIASMSVLSTGEWRVIYTDGTSETVGYDVYSALDALKTAAQEAAETASGAAGTAVDAATSAATSAANAADSAESAATSAENAERDADHAEQGARNAQESATAAGGSASAAAGSASSAASANTAAQQAKTDAETAARNAEEWASQVDPDQLAHIDGYYPDMTVGNAEQLVSTLFVEDTEPYTFRKAGGSHDIGNREYDEIVGGSLPWNQLIANGNFAEGTTGWVGVAASISASGGVLTVTKNENASQSSGYAKQAGVKLTVGHKYLFTCEYKGIAGKQLSLYTNGAGAGRTTVVPEDENWHRNERVIEVTEIPSVTAIFWLSYATTTGDNVAQFRNICYFDLTLMFGTEIADYIYSLETANAGAGVTWFRKLFSKDYYAYNAGTMAHVQTSAHETVGFNQWDEEWEPGSIDETGQNASNVDRIRSKNYISVLPGTVYYIKKPTKSTRIFYYDAYKNLISYSPSFTVDKTFTTPEKCCYIRFWNQLRPFNNDICINLSWDGSRDGEYEPYVKHAYPLDSSLTLRGIPTLDGDKLKFNGDRYTSDGTVQRNYGEDRLDALRWTRTNDGVTSGGYVFSCINSRFGASACVSSKYEYAGAVSSNNVAYSRGDKTLSRRASGGRIYIRDDAYTTVEDFVAALGDATIVYPLAEPTTETAEPFQSPQIVDDFGTEEYVDAGLAAGTRDFAFPVGHDTKYPPNLRDKLQKLPSAAAENGRYVIQQTDGNMALVPDTSPGQIAALAVKVPDPPTADGTYRLTVTMTDGIPAYSWVSE